jgi:hypothetical protein
MIWLGCKESLLAAGQLAKAIQKVLRGQHCARAIASSMAHGKEASQSTEEA